MTKTELIEKVAGRLELPASEAEKVVNTIFDSMAASLVGGERVEIPGFGEFEVLWDDGGARGGIQRLTRDDRMNGKSTCI